MSSSDDEIFDLNNISDSDSEGYAPPTKAKVTHLFVDTRRDLSACLLQKGAVKAKPAAKPRAGSGATKNKPTKVLKEIENGTDPMDMGSGDDSVSDAGPSKTPAVQAPKGKDKTATEMYQKVAPFSNNLERVFSSLCS